MNYIYIFFLTWEIKRHPQCLHRGIPGRSKIVWNFYPLKPHGQFNNLHVNISIIEAYWIKRSDTYLLTFDIDPSCQSSSKPMSPTTRPPLVRRDSLLVSLYGFSWVCFKALANLNSCRVPSYIRETYYCTLARYGTRKEYNYITEKITVVEDEEEKKRLLSSFACFQAPWILQS